MKESGILMDKNNDEMKNKVKCEDKEIGEDATKYGEFVSSYFAWMSLSEQKDKVEKLQNVTKKNNK